MDAKDVVTVWMYLRDMLVVYVSIILTHETGSTYLRRLFDYMSCLNQIITITSTDYTQPKTTCE